MFEGPPSGALRVLPCSARRRATGTSGGVQSALGKGVPRGVSRHDRSSIYLLTFLTPSLCLFCMCVSG